MPDAFELAHARLAATQHRIPKETDEVWAMQMVLEIPKVNPPNRNDLLVAAARSVVALCLGISSAGAFSVNTDIRGAQEVVVTVQDTAHYTASGSRTYNAPTRGGGDD